MRLSTSTNILFERNKKEHIPQETSIRLCAEAGYRVMDFCFHDLTTYDSPFLGNRWEHYMDSIRNRAAECGIVFSQSHGILYDFCNVDEDHNTKRRLMERCVLGAKMLGIPWLVIHPYTDFNSPTVVKTSKEKNIDYISRLGEFADRHGVGIALENMWDLGIAPLRRYGANGEELVDLVDSIGGIGICWDVEHASIMRQNQTQAITLMGSRLKCTHISDQTGLDNIHILPCLGVTDWDEVMQALARISYTGDFTFETHGFLGRMPMELVPESLKYSVSVGNYLVRKFEHYGSVFARDSVCEQTQL